MDKLQTLLNTVVDNIFNIGTALIVVSCLWQSLTCFIKHDPKGAIQIIIQYVVAYVVFVLIPSMFVYIRANLK